jgi:hypothetical protein
MALAEYRANEAARDITTTGGTKVGQTSAGKRLVVRNGKTQNGKSLAELREAFLRLRQANSNRSLA